MVKLILGNPPEDTLAAFKTVSLVIKNTESTTVYKLVGYDIIHFREFMTYERAACWFGGAELSSLEIFPGKGVEPKALQYLVTRIRRPLSANELGGAVPSMARESEQT